jgi:hypothetical protein
MYSVGDIPLGYHSDGPYRLPLGVTKAHPRGTRYWCTNKMKHHLEEIYYYR